MEMSGTIYRYENRARNLFTEYVNHPDMHKCICCDMCGFDDIRGLTLVGEDEKIALEYDPLQKYKIMCYNCYHISKVAKYHVSIAENSGFIKGIDADKLDEIIKKNSTELEPSKDGKVDE